MIDIITADRVRRLADTELDHCVSVYLPTDPAGSDVGQNPIRLKNVLAQAAAALEELGVRPRDATKRLADIAELLGEHAFWLQLGEGLAAFVGDDTTILRLPHRVDELVVVADHFHIKPVLPAITTGERFFVLALSQNHVRLLRGSRYRVDELVLGDIPESLAEALWFDDRDRQLTSYSATRVGRGSVTASFHGQGIGKDTHDADLDRFLTAVDGGVRHLIEDGAPLVLAGVEHLVARYRHLSHVGSIAEGAVFGNPERFRPEQLHAAAWPLVRPGFDEEEKDARTRFLTGRSPNVSTVASAVLAAHDGRVDSVFLPVGVQRWGRFDVAERHVDEHDEHRPGDRDLLDAVAIDTLRAGGRVYAVDPADVPDGGLLAGTLRY